MGTIRYKNTISSMQAIKLVDLLVGRKFKLDEKDAVVTSVDVHPDSTIINIEEEGDKKHKIIFLVRR